MSGPPVDHVHWGSDSGPWSARREWVYDLTWDVPPVWDIPAAFAASILVMGMGLHITKVGEAREARERHPFLHKWATEGTLGLLGIKSPRVPRPREGKPEVVECHRCRGRFTTTHFETTHCRVCPSCGGGFNWPEDRAKNRAHRTMR